MFIRREVLDCRKAKGPPLTDRAAGAFGGGKRSVCESAPQQQRESMPSAPTSNRGPAQKEGERVDSPTTELSSHPSRKERQPRKRSRERQMREAEGEDRQAAVPRRRVIPTPPHRQLFLVKDNSFGEGWINIKEHKSLLAAYATDPGCGGSAAGVSPGERRVGAPAPALFNCTDIRKPSPASVPFDALPPPLSGARLSSHPLGTRPRQAGSPTYSPTAPSPTARAASPDFRDGRRKGRQVGKLRFCEPVELQVESISALAMRLTLVLWYACLIAALVVEVIPKVQWSMVNICGATHGVDIRYMHEWTSPCVTFLPTAAANGTLEAPKTVSLRWGGADLTPLQSNMARYRRLAFSLSTPSGQRSGVQQYRLVAETRISGAGVDWVSEYPLSVRCDTTKRRCDVARVPELLLGNTPRFSGEFSFTLTLVPESLAAGAAGSSVGIAYQRHAYTCATLVWRYVLMFLSLIHTLRFIAYCKYTSILYEQGWTILLQVALLWYMNPLFALNITIWPLSSMLAFMEYRIPTYFMAVLTAYMLSVITASMAWARPAVAKPDDGVFAKLKAFLVRSRNVYDPPMWTKILIAVYMLSVFVLDTIDACVERNAWYSGSNNESGYRRLYVLVMIVHLAGGLVCLSLLLYLRNYLGSKPYLESRPQQLACRVFLMIFLSAIAYCVAHCLVFFLLYNRGHPALASQQPFLQLPMLMMTSFFVNIMTLVYTSQNRDESVPVHPQDPRWKHMVWPDTWYRWLARHGGSQYIFATEQEETRFYRLQFEFRRRQFMARQKRLKSVSGALSGLDLSSAGSVAFAASSERAQNTMRPDWPSSMRDLRDEGRSMTSLQQRVNGASALGCTDGEEPLQAGVQVSASDTDAVAVGCGGRIQRSESPAVRDNDRGAASPARRDDQSGVPTVRGESHQAGERMRGGGFDIDSEAAATATTFEARGSDFCRSRCAVGSNRLAPVDVAARHVMNMDRFSTYFLADGVDMAGRGAGGVAKLYSDLTCGRPSTRDTYAIAGPARRRSRMLRSASPMQGCHGEDGSVTASGLSQLQGSLGANAVACTWSGSHRREGRMSLPPAQLGLAGRCQHNSRSHSDGDAPINSRGNDDVESAMPNCKAPAGHDALPLAQQSRYQDPLAGVTVSGCTESPVEAALRPPWAAAAASADTVVLPPTDAEEEDGGGIWRRSEGGLAPRTHSGSCARQRDDLQGPVLPLRAPTAGGAGVIGSSHLKGALCLDQQDPLALSRLASVLGADLPSLAPTSRTGEGDVRQCSVHGGADSRPHAESLDDDAPSNLSFHSSSDSDDDGRSDRTHESAHFLRRTLTLARERLGALMGTAEQNLLERPVRGLNRLETHIFNAAYRPFQSIQYLPFFNLETAIDCFNISWEAYGVEESTGDQAIGTGIKVTPQNVPRTVAHGIKKVICGCCPAEEDSSDADAEDVIESELGRGVAVGARDSDEGAAAVAPATGSDGTERMVHPITTQQGCDSNVVIVDRRSDSHSRGTSGEFDTRAAAPQRILTPALAGKGSSNHLASPPEGPKPDAPAPVKAATAVPNHAALPINVEQYGFVRLLVAEAKEVQVLMVKMDTDAPEHKGKAPRVIIGFRGTANMSNAKHDMNIHRVVWREMEAAAYRGAADASGEETSEIASNLDDNDDVTTAQYLGCASCIRSCMRKTPWRPTCHAGFLAIWKTLKPTVLSRLRGLLCDDPDTVFRIFTTGHSLGGALASLCAYSITNMLKRMDYPIADVTVYTYGQPRMGNRTFQRIYDKTVPRSFRVVNESDVVVSMTMFGGYHVGIEVDVDRHGNFIVKPTAIERLFPPTKGRGLTLVNHLMRNYGTSLNAIASRTACPARGLDFYSTADPEKVKAAREKAAAVHLMQS
ncbi:hypothetical protein LSCM1_04424 [Leishmania martiniquensis]|uniref:Fungal lipase-type domain-containing protein n=1 Tax=Leishmania martiniquensis TaxID=1580590 RepID=A0A836KF04_9TRYP|nr:hypothetical protein LSCM1_04424 [Leishmania martiniquensis]